MMRARDGSTGVGSPFHARRRELLRRAAEDGERLYRKSMHDPDGIVTIADWNRIYGLLTRELTDALGLVDELVHRLDLACAPCTECGHVDWRELNA